MLTGFVLANVAVSGLAVMTSPLLFRGLLELHYPPTFRGEPSGALDTVCAPQRPRISRPRSRDSTICALNPRTDGSTVPPNSGWGMRHESSKG